MISSKAKISLGIFLFYLSLSSTVTKGEALQEPVTFLVYPKEDASVAFNFPNENYGQDDYLIAHYWPVSPPPIDRPPEARRNFYIKFDLSEYSELDMISVKLKMYVVSAGYDGSDIGIYYTSDNGWTESNINGNNAPNFSNTLLDSEWIGSDNKWISFDLHSELNEMQNQGVITYVIRIQDTTGSNHDIRFASQESENNQYIPYLEITYIPPPPQELIIVSELGETFGDGVFNIGSIQEFQVSPEIILSEKPGERFVFNRWTSHQKSGYNGPNNPASVTLTSEDIIQTAIWKTQHYLEIYSSGNGTVSSISGWYDTGSIVILDPTPDYGFKVQKWEGLGPGSYSGTHENPEITINAPISQSVSFIEVPKYRLELVSEHGTKYGEGDYYVDSNVEFRIEPVNISSSGIRFIFESWSSSTPEGYSGNDNPAYVIMKRDITETAQWKTRFKLTVVSPYEVHGSGWYNKGDRVKIETLPVTEHLIRKIPSKWNDGVTSYSLDTLVSIDGPKTISIEYSQDYSSLIFVVIISAAIIIVILTLIRASRKKALQRLILTKEQILNEIINAPEGILLSDLSKKFNLLTERVKSIIYEHQKENDLVGVFIEDGERFITDSNLRLLTMTKAKVEEMEKPVGDIPKKVSVYDPILDEFLSKKYENVIVEIANEDLDALKIQLEIRVCERHLNIKITIENGDLILTKLDSDNRV